ncbi:thioredoxin-like domain-containing protein [Mucilaginibacter phyllosphaerae]
MRYYPLLAIALLLSACNAPKADLTFKAAGIKSGTIQLRRGNEILLTKEIKDGSAAINKPIDTPGYYNVTVIDDAKTLSAKNNFEVYLENGSYTIEPKEGNKAYPVITSGSKTQQQLSDYYKVTDEMAGSLDHTIDSLLNYLDSREVRNLGKKERSALIVKTRGYQIERRKAEPGILEAYLKKHPDNTVAAHIMAQQYVDEYPAEYNTLLNKLSAEAKKTPDGQTVTDKLSLLVKLLPGSVAPNITGVTLDGKPFNKKAIKAKVILVEFWVSKSELSEQNHAKMLNSLILGDNDRKQFAMVSVSTDTDEKVWKSAIQQSNLNWPQVTDLKGDSSPNVANWKIKAVPSYFLVDGSWHILKANIDIIDVDQEVHDYLKTH